MPIPPNFSQRSPVQGSVTAGATATTGVSSGIRIFYKGDPADAAEPGVGYAAASSPKITFYTNFTATTYDTAIASDGGKTFTGTTTLLEVVNWINSTKNWGAILVGGLTKDVLGTSSANVAALTAAAVPAAGALLLLNTVATGTGSPGIASVCIGPEALGTLFGAPSSLRSASNIAPWVPDFAAVTARPKGLKRQVLDATNIVQYVKAYMGTATATSPSLEVYDATQSGETLVATLPVTASNATATEYKLTDLAAEIQSVPGHRLVVRLQGSGTVAGQAINHTLSVNGVTGILDINKR